MSWIWAKLALPMMRLASMRPATRTLRLRAAIASAFHVSGICKLRLQVTGKRVDAEVVGEVRPFTQAVQLFATFGNQLVLIQCGCSTWHGKRWIDRCCQSRSLLLPKFGCVSIREP